jgi:hypothetical protein
LTGSPLTKEIVAMERSRRRETRAHANLERREEDVLVAVITTESHSTRVGCRGSRKALIKSKR